MKKLIAPSILSADFSKLGEEIKAVEKAGANWIHVDVMDGHFVPNLTIGPVVVSSLRKVTKLPLDVHLMIQNPDDYIEAFAKAGATSLTVHVEASTHLRRSIAAIKSLGVRAGVSLNPATPISLLEEILPEVDLILVMSVNPGFGGQKFISKTLTKVRKLNKIRKQRNLKFLIEVDGGVSCQNIKEISQAGCDVFVAGSAIFHSKSYLSTIKEMRKSLEITD